MEKANRYFAASNSARGFVCYYDRCFGGADRRVIIKGGPGTGKSHLLAQIAAYAAARGYHVRYYYCSSDVESLDGILLEKDGKSVAVMDGTAPHAVEASLPGVRDEILDVGRFWDADGLRLHRAEILMHMERKAAAFRRGYRYLQAYGIFEEIIGALSSPFVLREKMKTAAYRLLRDVPIGSGYQETIGLCRGIGMKGLSHFDTYETTPGSLTVLEDHEGVAGEFLLCLREAAQKAEQPLHLSFDPYLPEKPDALYLPQIGLSVVIGRGEEMERPCRVISMNRYLDTEGLRPLRPRLREAARLSLLALTGAVGAFADASVSHFALEDVYSAHMNFDAETAAGVSFCRHMFGL